MEHLYNPEQMPEQEIKDTFVAREVLVNRLVQIVRHQPEGAGVRHVVIVAPRGMGKTTMLLMVQFAVADLGLGDSWLTVRFPEELYGVCDLADFWLETLEGVSRASGDTTLPHRVQIIRQRYPDSTHLQEAALALLKDWCREHGRRLLLLVDNFNQILAQINDEQQNAALRNVLMNEGFLMILGAAPTFFKEASNYDQPLYNFFQIERLDRLSFEDMLELLRRRAAADGLVDFNKILDANVTRLRVLEYFTGGNVRLALMLYRVVAQSELLEVRQGLEKLLDQVTPFFKAKTEDLPPQQRKILDFIARETGRTHEGVSPSDVAVGVRLTPQVVSAQLKRLTDQGYVQSANLRGRSTFYVLSEPLYSLWYQMRFGRDARERMGWLVNFLKAWYDATELSAENHRLEAHFKKLFDAGLVEEARKILEHQRFIAEALNDDLARARALNSLVHGYLSLKDSTAVSDLVSAFDPRQFDIPTTGKLMNSGYLVKEEQARFKYNMTKSSKAKSEQTELTGQPVAFFSLISYALQGHVDIVRELIAKCETVELFFPLVRALDYIQTGDEALIEKLTPEMRPIVEEVIKKLRPATGETKTDAPVT